jgi:hypothetical protein
MPDIQSRQHAGPLESCYTRDWIRLPLLIAVLINHPATGFSSLKE